MAGKRKQDNSLALVLGAALCIYALYQFIANNSSAAIFIVAAVVAIVAVALPLPRRINRRRVFSKTKALIDQHADDLAKRRAQLVRQDAYGKPLLDKWHKEVDYFITEHIRPALTIKQQSILESTRNEIACMVMERAEARAVQAPVFKAFSDSMTPTEFETFCAEQLRSSGWETHLTPTTGDQGVDVVAEKNGFSIVLQCKLYSGSVGNSAIQEVVAGKGYYHAEHGAVVTNRTYTSAAEQLASVHGILLLHYSDLPRLEGMIRHNPVPSLAPPHCSEPTVVAHVQVAPLTQVVPSQDLSPSSLPPRSRFMTKEALIVGCGFIIIVLANVLFSNSGRKVAPRTDNKFTPKASSPVVRKPAPEFTSYSNTRFGFRIDYPNTFLLKSTAEADDGTTFTSPDGVASLVVNGANNTDGSTAQDYYRNCLAGITGAIGYVRGGETWFVVSWKENNQVYYRKMFVGSGSQNSFTFVFPENQRSTYETIVTRMEKSFRPGALDDAH